MTEPTNHVDLQRAQFVPADGEDFGMEEMWVTRIHAGTGTTTGFVTVSADAPDDDTSTFAGKMRLELDLLPDDAEALARQLVAAAGVMSAE